MFDVLEKRIRQVIPAGGHFTFRCVRERSERLEVRCGQLQPVTNTEDAGVMVTAYIDGAAGYAATPDLSVAGLRNAADRAARWARQLAGRTVDPLPPPHTVNGQYVTPVDVAWDSVSLADKVVRLHEADSQLRVANTVVDHSASFWFSRVESLWLDSAGGRVWQDLHYFMPNLRAVANRHSDTQIRTLGGGGHLYQAGLEALDVVDWQESPRRVGEQAVTLLDTPDCPSGAMDVVLAPDQMILQIHESIGHPLELDRILGDERNYAGGSFVTLDMFGDYVYGSSLLNVTYDPKVAQQAASFGFDDEAEPAERQYIIRHGRLLRPLGGRLSQSRAGVHGVACSRASGWQRPPIDRMANLNVEPGDASLEDMIGRVERGVYMESNRSWSIDDRRNKFQFGCEWGRLIEDGRLTQVVKNPNYRGVSARFWRSLSGVGDRGTYQVLGTPYCGKGEPNQIIRVGHATPACLFTQVDVFGGE